MVNNDDVRAISDERFKELVREKCLLGADESSLQQCIVFNTENSMHLTAAASIRGESSPDDGGFAYAIVLTIFLIILDPEDPDPPPPGDDTDPRFPPRGDDDGQQDRGDDDDDDGPTDAGDGSGVGDST